MNPVMEAALAAAAARQKPGRTKQTARKVTGNMGFSAATMARGFTRVEGVGMVAQSDLDDGYTPVESLLFLALESGRDEIIEDKLDDTCLLTKEAINEAWKRFLCGRYGVGDAICPLGKYEVMLKLLDMSRYPEHDPANAFVIPQLVFGRNKPKYPATREACVAEGHHHFYFLDGLAAVANDREGLPDEVEANRDHLEHELIDAVKEMLEEEEDEEDDGGAYVPPIAAGRTYEDVDGGAFKKWSADHETDTDETKALKARVRAKLGIADAPAAGASAEAEADDAGDGDAERRVRARTE